MTPKPHKVWRVRIASLDDYARRVARGQRAFICGLPTRGTYLIEAKGQGAIAEKKALKQAAEDGIASPILQGIECVNLQRR